MFYLHKINLYVVVGVNQCRRKSASLKISNKVKVNFFNIDTKIAELVPDIDTTSS